jgi:hypothetical protein
VSTEKLSRPPLCNLFLLIWPGCLLVVWPTPQEMLPWKARNKFWVSLEYCTVQYCTSFLLMLVYDIMLAVPFFGFCFRFSSPPPFQHVLYMSRQSEQRMPRQVLTAERLEFPVQVQRTWQLNSSPCPNLDDLREYLFHAHQNGKQ